jgi:hypothetical protein
VGGCDHPSGRFPGAGSGHNMRSVSEKSPRSREWERRVDTLVVLLVLALSIVQIDGNVIADVAGEPRDLDALGLALAAVMVLPLYRRRRHPWVAMGFAGGGSIALVACGYPVHIPFALIVALFGFAADSRRAMWPPAAFAAALFAVQVLVEHEVLGLSLEDYVLPIPLLIGAWVLGERRRTAELREIEARDRREREQQLAVAEERTTRPGTRSTRSSFRPVPRVSCGSANRNSPVPRSRRSRSSPARRSTTSTGSSARSAPWNRPSWHRCRDSTGFRTWSNTSAGQVSRSPWRRPGRGAAHLRLRSAGRLTGLPRRAFRMRPVTARGRSRSESTEASTGWS